MNLELGDIVPEALHKKVGWDMRHHFMAEKIIDSFGLTLPLDRELVRQLAVVYVLGRLKAPPEVDGDEDRLSNAASTPHLAARKRYTQRTA